MRKLSLISDCSACTGLCCVAHAFDRSEAFAFDKAAGERCRHLTASFRCAVHARRAEMGCGGCVAYECYGAGQEASRRFAGEVEAVQLQAFLVPRGLHELMWLLSGALEMCPGELRELRRDLEGALAEIEGITAGASDRQLIELDIRALEVNCRRLLRKLGRALGGS